MISLAHELFMSEYYTLTLTRQKLQNSKGYAKSLEFSPALGLIILGKKSVATNFR